MINDLKTSGTHISYWTNSVVPRMYKPLDKNIDTDIVIVGGGISGITMAYELTLRGRDVVIIEDGMIGSGETGRTTAHLTCALDDRYYHLENVHGKEKAKLAAESHNAAIGYIETIVKNEQIDCDFERLDGYLFLHPSDKIESLKKEFEATREAGLKTEWLDNVPGIGKESGPCIKFPAQAQFHIMKYLHGLCTAIEKRNGKIFTETHAAKIDEKGIETTGKHRVNANHVVIATNTPVNNRFVIHTKQSPHRTYVIGARVQKGLSKALWWDTGDQEIKGTAQPYHYVRMAALDDQHDLLICGGEDHMTGVADNDVPEENRYGRLEQWTRERFPVEEVVYRWSGQVMEPMDGMAFIGRNPMDSDNTYIVTGDSGNGMTHGTIAAMIIPDLIEGKQHPWAGLYDPDRFKFLSVGQNFIRDNTIVVRELIKGYAHHPELKALREVKKDEGRIVEIKGEKYGAYRDARDMLHIVSVQCPHLGCIVRWNNDENSWDCPCHGSRFTIEGKVINGPSNSDLSYYHFPEETF